MGDAVPEADDGAERVVDRGRWMTEVLDLLERDTNVSPEMNRTGSRLAIAMPAAVTMFVAPGPIDDVQTMTCCRRIAFAKAAAASPMPCSL
jgi:hypothetical protein